MKPFSDTPYTLKNVPPRIPISGILEKHWLLGALATSHCESRVVSFQPNMADFSLFLTQSHLVARAPTAKKRFACIYGGMHSEGGDGCEVIIGCYCVSERAGLRLASPPDSGSAHRHQKCFTCVCIRACPSEGVFARVPEEVQLWVFSPLAILRKTPKALPKLAE